MQVDIKILEKILYCAVICLAGLENGFALIHQFVEQSASDVVGAVVGADADADAADTADADPSKRLTSGLGLFGIF